jgi:hypothetical protein
MSTVALILIVIGALIVIAALTSSDDRDLWLNLATEAAGVLLGGSVVAYLFERILRREEQAREARETAKVTLTASLTINDTIGKVAMLVSTNLTRALDLNPPDRGEPLNAVLRALAAQLTDKFKRPLDDIWDPDGHETTTVLDRITALHTDQLAVARRLVTDIVQALDHLRGNLGSLLQTVTDVELLTLLSAADAPRYRFTADLAGWESPASAAGPFVAFKRLPELLEICADIVTLIEQRTNARFAYERPVERASTHDHEKP